MLAGGGDEDALEVEGRACDCGCGLFPLGVQDAQVRKTRVGNVTEFESQTHLYGIFALRAKVAGSSLAEIVPVGSEVFAGSDVAQVIVVAIGAADQVTAALECDIGQD